MINVLDKINTEVKGGPFIYYRLYIEHFKMWDF